jgi:seryl-tRNA synthetase
VIDLRRLRQDPQGVRAQLARRLDPAIDELLDQLLALDARRREVLVRAEALKAERNEATAEVARRKRAREPADELMAALKESGETVKALDAELRDIETVLEQRALEVPNLPLAACPDGDATANRVVRTWGDPPRPSFTPLPHWELGERLGILDLPRGAKLAGSGFPVFVGLGARLVRALANFMLDLHTREHGYIEVAPPLLLNRSSLLGTGQLPKFEEELYAAERDGFYLLPTAEVPVTNLHRDEILEGADLPRGYVAFTPCFRREAGAHGKDTRGLIRVHQFDKVELVRLARPEESPAEHELMTGHAEAVLRRLGRRRWLARGVECLDLHRFPGAARQHPLPARGRRQAGVRAHAQRQRGGVPPHHHRAAGKRTAGGRLRPHSRGARALPGDRSPGPACVATPSAGSRQAPSSSSRRCSSA